MTIHDLGEGEGQYRGCYNKVESGVTKQDAVDREPGTEMLMLEEILDVLQERIVRYRRDDRTIEYCNAAWARAYDCAPADLVGRRLDAVFSPAELAQIEAQTARLDGGTAVLADETARPAPEDPRRLIEWVDHLVSNDDGASVVAVGRDVTDQERARKELEESEQRFRELADQSADVVFRFRLKPQPHFDYMSPSVEHVIGYPADQLRDIGQFLEILHDDDVAFLQGVLAGEPIPERYDLRFRRPDGSMVIGEMRVTLLADGILGVGRDVTEVRELQAKLAALALRDPLTGLANRRLLDEVLGLALSRTDRSGQPLAIAALDLDGFKQVNDVHGHDAGDAVLIETAKRLSKTVRDADVVARIGGDEFVIVHEAVGAGTPALVDRLMEALSEPIEIADGVTVTCPASVGVVDTGTSGRDPAELLAAADAAMYQAKRARSSRA